MDTSIYFLNGFYKLFDLVVVYAKFGQMYTDIELPLFFQAGQFS